MDTHDQQATRLQHALSRILSSILVATCTGTKNQHKEDIFWPDISADIRTKLRSGPPNLGKTRLLAPTCCGDVHEKNRSSKWHYRQRKIIFELIMHFIADTDTDENCFGINFLLQIQTQLFFAV